MSPMQSLLFFGSIALGTALTRFLPFWIFPDSRRVPPFLQYCGRALPFAVMGMLVVYCLRGVTLTAFPFGLPEGAAVAAVAALHLWKRNTLLSIGGGTLVYMALIHGAF